MEYQKNMDGVDRCHQHRTDWEGFTNVAHFQKWYKKVFLIISDFSLIQEFTAYDMSVDELSYRGRGGVLIHNNLV